MDLILNRYRNVTVLLLAILAQLVLLAYQVKSNGEVRLIRVWAVTAVTPMARVLETGRSGVFHFFRDYFVLLGTREENQILRSELNRLNMENQYLRTELSTADRARALSIFQQRSPSKTLAAHVIGNTTGTTAKVVIIDRGTSSGVQKELAVITPEGIVGKVISAYPMSSFVRLITDGTFAAGVVSQKNHVAGTLRGQGNSSVIVDHVQNESVVEQGEWFYTSGDDLIFPKGLPVGQVNVVRPGKGKKEIFLTPAGLQNGLEEVLIIMEGVHTPVPDQAPSSQPVHIQPPPATEITGDGTATPAAAPVQSGPVSTDADRMVDRYRKIGEAQKHVYGEHGGRAPDYNAPIPAVSAAAPAAPAQQQQQ
jgi:rod shape-determining protein MreC